MNTDVFSERHKQEGRPEPARLLVSITNEIPRSLLKGVAGQALGRGRVRDQHESCRKVHKLDSDNRRGTDGQMDGSDSEERKSAGVDEQLASGSSEEESAGVDERLASGSSEEVYE